MGADCHEIGHVGDAADCADSFDACATFCLAELEKREEGAGGRNGVHWRAWSRDAATLRGARFAQVGLVLQPGTSGEKPSVTRFGFH
jgi:hypothetical protein